MSEPKDLSGVLEEVRFHADGYATAVVRDSRGLRLKILFSPTQLRQLRGDEPVATVRSASPDEDTYE